MSRFVTAARHTAQRGGMKGGILCVDLSRWGEGAVRLGLVEHTGKVVEVPMGIEDVLWLQGQLARLSPGVLRPHVELELAVDAFLNAVDPGQFQPNTLERTVHSAASLLKQALLGNWVAKVRIPKERRK